jgi:hypothetical protein
MDREAALTVGLVALVAGSATFFLLLTVVGAFTDGLGWIRFAAAGLPALLVAGGAATLVRDRASPEQLSGR